MTASKQRPGCDPGALKDTRLGGGESFAMVTRGADDDPVTARLWRLHDRCGYLTRAELGERAPVRPSSYSLPAVELAAYVRQLRRQGWQRWEVRARFEFGDAA